MIDHRYPRVSFVVIAFNQKDFIEEAVASALVQDYPNLQIILSDDNSSDDTFERMQAMAAAYSGPHAIVLNRASGGRGILAHFYDALQYADGVLTVGAAGDDISAPNRVSKLVGTWRGTKAVAIYSAWNQVDLAGTFMSRSGIKNQRDREMSAYFPDRDVTIAFGCTAAYDTAFLQSIPIPNGTIWAEDYFWSAVAMMSGEEILYIDDTLVSYRQNPGALRNFSLREEDYLAYELRENRFSAGKANLLEALLTILRQGTPPAGTRVNRDAIVHNLAWYRYRADWPHRSFLGRVRCTAGLRSLQRLRWAVPRLPGLGPFIRLKTMLSALRR